MFVVSLPPLQIGTCFMPQGLALPSTIPGLAPARNLISLAQDSSNVTAREELFTAAGLIDSRNAKQADQYGPVVDAFVLQHLARDPYTGKIQPLRSGLFTVTMPVPPLDALTGTLRALHTAIVNDARARVGKDAPLTPFMQLHIPTQWTTDEHYLADVQAYVRNPEHWNDGWLRSLKLGDAAGVTTFLEGLAAGARLLISDGTEGHALVARLLEGGLNVPVADALNSAVLPTDELAATGADADVME
ncbi:MAG: hypothetical protein COX62_07785 [Deltaproteobacteria bacterium CG_4_10_14_0_2_um_filter_43_8]|nr:MAG: hypothetical protein COV43_01250 [Deltaproteobacteria bacterium CG11_big_fil_rev_8_21_14_0_20_42_23]PJA18898.1 MAG: hypothetical protein COX62_07785 [Deltaproteobacteria bacterium CG_4_10_14_0_2_um_filter_43_8]PJC63525.1 MAG: hypothetical protein CO021_08745 [Deltaproteobacteria bacterium CG_4_9_14_0_2_um_filter_42_21]